MFVQLLVSGIAMGFVYALVAIEYTLIWNSCSLLNFSHGQLIMLGAYIFGGTFVTGLGFSYAMGWIGTIALVAILGTILAFVIFIPLKDFGSLYAIVATMLFGIVISNLVPLIYGIYPIHLNNYLSGIYKIGNMVITRAYFYIIIVAVLAVTALLCFMKYTKIGKDCTCRNSGYDPGICDLYSVKGFWELICDCSHDAVRNSYFEPGSSDLWYLSDSFE